MSSHKWLLIIILATNFALNVWGLDWGLPERWHPDELLNKVELMVEVGAVNHNYYTYGSLPFYRIAALAVWPAMIGQAWLGWHDFEVLSVDNLLARLQSALMGTGIVWAVYGIGKQLFDRRTGLISAAFMGLTMGLVNLSHFATVDIPSLGWFSWCSYMSVLMWRRGSSRAYVGAGIFCGLAAAARYVGGISMIVILTAHFLRPKRP